VAFSDRVQSATRAILTGVPQVRQPNESFDAYAERAVNAARDRVGPIRDLVEQERQSIADMDVASCPTATRYRILVNAYSVVVNAIWAAVYAPTPGSSTRVSRTSMPQCLAGVGGRTAEDGTGRVWRRP
jgi:hypothetical protein